VGEGDLAIPHSRLAQHLVPGTCEHPTHKTATKVSHTVQRVCDPLRIGIAAGFSVSTALLLRKLFTFCAYFSRIAVNSADSSGLAIEGVGMWPLAFSDFGLESRRGH